MLFRARKGATSVKVPVAQDHIQNLISKIRKAESVHVVSLCGSIVVSKRRLGEQ